MTTKLPCCETETKTGDTGPVYWNPYNGFTQCHACGEIYLSRTEMNEFIGWLSGDIHELHAVEVPRLADSLQKFINMKAEERGTFMDFSSNQPQPATI